MQTDEADKAAFGGLKKVGNFFFQASDKVIMKQRHSYHRLLYHLVLHTKNRERIIRTVDEETEIAGYLKLKARELDCYVDEIGSWDDHVHLLLRTGVTIALCRIYRELKGFSARAWNLRHIKQRLYWGDGAFIATVDPDNAEPLRQYIRNQRKHHDGEELNPAWECE